MHGGYTRVAALALAGLLAGCNVVGAGGGEAVGEVADRRGHDTPGHGLDDGEAAADPWLETPVRAAAPAAGATRAFAFEAAQPLALPDDAVECGFPALPDSAGYRLYAAGAYGGRDAGFHIDRSGHEATLMDVAVNESDAPVALMLGSYEPAVWNIGWTSGTRIVAVLVGGHHRQAVTGLPADVPVIVSTHKGKGACGHFHVSPKKPEALVPVAQRMFSRSIDMVYPAVEGRVVIGKPLAPGAGLVTDAHARPARSFRVDDSQAGGPAGLAYAASRGWLREAGPADVAAWQDAVDRDRSAAGTTPPVAGGRPRPTMSLHNAYVVLQAFEFPPGLHGANSGTFFVPEGVPRPTGSAGHSNVYDFNTLGCNGPGCGRD